MHIVRASICVLIRAYQKTFSPSTGFLRFLPLYPKPSCPFIPTCSQYALIAFTTLPLSKAFPKVIHRIMRCTPWRTPTVDYP